MIKPKNNIMPNKWRYGVGIILLNKKREVFMGERLDNRGAWQMPQGGLNKNENALDGAKRELYEETGVTSIRNIYESKDWFSYKLPPELSKRLWKGKYIGQKQKWFVFEHRKDDHEINLKSTKKPEFISWKWVDFKDITDNIVFFKKELYLKIIEEFSGVIYNYE